MNTQQLKCFVAVAEKLSFTKAAAELYFSVPTVTHHIQSLESELGSTLLLRTKHSVQLTQAGRAFYDDARQLLQMEESARNRVAERETAQTIHIGCTSHAELYLVSRVLTRFKSEYPEIRPDIIVDDYSRCLTLLGSLELDFMFGSDNMAIEHDDLRLEFMGTQQSYAMFNKDDPMSGMEEVSFEDLNSRRLVCLHDRVIPMYSRNRIREMLTLHHNLQQDYICADEEIALAMVAGGYGPIVLPEYRIAPHMYREFAVLPVRETQEYRYGILVRKGQQTKPVRDMIAMTKELYQ